MAKIHVAIRIIGIADRFICIHCFYHISAPTFAEKKKECNMCTIPLGLFQFLTLKSEMICTLSSAALVETENLRICSSISAPLLSGLFIT